MVILSSYKQMFKTKKEWIARLSDDLAPVVEMEIITKEPKGFHLCVFWDSD